IIALVALYRPGPLGSGMVDDFIDCKHGIKEVVYPLPQLEPILKETYGVILYQEQVMKIAQTLAGYTLGGADLLRRAMGKKKPEEMAAQREVFMAGARKNAIDLKKAEHIFDLMEKFAGYGFNKSHSAAYALISYQTAWLKAHYPKEFLAATLTCDITNTDKVIRFVQECRNMGVEMMPPDVNASQRVFAVEGDGIRYGLAAVKNVGDAAVDAMVVERDHNGPFQDLFDLCQRVDSGSLNRRVMENLIKAGAMDSIDENRASLLEILPTAMSWGAKRQEEVSQQQASLFATAETEEGAWSRPSMPEVRPWDVETVLSNENTSLGFYMSGHPVNAFADEFAAYGLPSTRGIRVRLGVESPPPEELREHPVRDGLEKGGLSLGSSPQAKRPWQKRGGEGGSDPILTFAGLVTGFRFHRSKGGDSMAFVMLEDHFGVVDAVIFPDNFQRLRDRFETGAIIAVEGETSVENDVVKMIITEAVPMDGLRERTCRSLRLDVDENLLMAGTLDALEDILKPHLGGSILPIFHVEMEHGTAVIPCGDRWRLHPREGLRRRLRELLGQEAVNFSTQMPDGIQSLSGKQPPNSPDGE
ncbi:MAG: DNA polymerase III subunit alpha, partial [Magnetococcales bacterium]|nr:DNA polymerase III subunit alpha [Magnetococcales bacterium]